jgi:hypothetical protein
MASTMRIRECWQMFNRCIHSYLFVSSSRLKNTNKILKIAIFWSKMAVLLGLHCCAQKNERLKMQYEFLSAGATGDLKCGLWTIKVQNIFFLLMLTSFPDYLDVICKQLVSRVSSGDQTLENNKTLALRARVSYRFLVFGSPDETLKLVVYI